MCTRVTHLHARWSVLDKVVSIGDKRELLRLPVWISYSCFHRKLDRTRTFSRNRSQKPSSSRVHPTISVRSYGTVMPRLTYTDSTRQVKRGKTSRFAKRSLRGDVRSRQSRARPWNAKRPDRARRPCFVKSLTPISTDRGSQI